MQPFEIKDWQHRKRLINKIYRKFYDKSIQYCHYTSAEAVKSIFSDYIQTCRGKKVTECKMRAGHLRFMNDYTEYEDGLHMLQKFRNDPDYFPSNNENMYSISFCCEQDLLSQWKWYGKDCGISIVFDLENVKYGYWKVEEGFEKIDSMQYEKSTKPIPVQYNIQEKKALFNYMNEAGIDAGNQKLLDSVFIPFCKQQQFSEEKESRLVFFPCERGADFTQTGIESFCTTYYISGGVVKPGLNVTFHAIDEKSNIINKLIIGPGQNQHLLFNSMIHIFDSEPFSFQKETEREHMCKNGVEIIKSDVSFRG